MKLSDKKKVIYNPVCLLNPLNEKSNNLNYAKIY